MPTHDPDIAQLLISLGLLAIEAGLFAFIIVMTCFTARYFRITWRPALAFGLLLFALSIPPALLAFQHLDITSAAPNIPPDMQGLVMVCAVIFAVAILIACIPIRALYLHVAAVEWSRLRGNPDTATTREMLSALAGPKATRKLSILVGAAVGVICAVVTLAIFYAVDVKEGEAIRQMQRWFPTIEQSSIFVTLLAGIAFVSSASILEEVIFRGALLGFLLRITKNQTALAWLSILFVAFLWSLLHIFNVDHPVLKVTQIFLHGIALGYMTRRWGLLSALASHLSLNLTALFAPLVIPGLR